MKQLLPVFFVSLILLFISQITNAQVYKVIESANDHIIVEFNFGSSYSVIDTIVEGKTFQKIKGVDHSIRRPGDPWVPEYKVLVGVPYESKSSIKILQYKQSTQKNKFIIPYPEEDPAFVKQDFDKINVEVYSKNELFPITSAGMEETYIIRYAKVLPISVSPFQFNPVTRELVYNSYVSVRIDFNSDQLGNIISVDDAMTDEFLKSAVINYEVAKYFSGKIVSDNLSALQNDYWYNPNKNYYKIYLTEEGVYRITFEDLINSGVPIGSGVSTEKLELFSNGQQVPIDVVDHGDSTFNAGDYLQFVGYPASPSANCSMNIYNLTNIYWFSYQSDSSGYFYKSKNGYPQTFSKTYYSSPHTIHSEKDSIYERLGYANSSNIDYWFWGKATAQNGQSTGYFEDYFDGFENHTLDSHWVNLKVAMHGLTNNPSCIIDHKAIISITEQPIGSIEWDGQQAKVFEKNFYVGDDSIRIFPTGNRLDVKVTGESCVTGSDEIRINWYEFTYWRTNRANANHFSFKSPDYGSIRFWISNWFRDDIKIYLPDRGKVISNPFITNDDYVIFVDTTNTGNPYFCASEDYYLTVDSIRADVPSNLRNLSNGCDYIIITHNKFTEIANQLATLRESNFPDESIPNPRIFIVDVQQIYDEFSFGLLNPNALKDFTQYAFENWQAPAPSYIVILGDMSYDYRSINPTSRPNFIPSIPYFAPQYGQAASDNLIVAVAGNDAAPDLAIGRLSIETVAEGEVLLQKLTDYPDDPTKPWKENVLLVASGTSLEDEINFGFNDASLFLGNNYVIPQGFNPSYVFRYPSKPEHEPYQGEGPKIREEINRGAALLNYYGHGGGYQWDLVFLNDDIYLLENEGRLPLILSVTCYTAHFDNQDVFGEQFNKVPGKGSIGFYGSSGLTYWGVGTAINRELFSEIFITRNYITGKAFMNSKNRVPPGGLYGIQLNLLTYLGDPVMKLALPEHPDFEIKSSDISLIPENPLVGDSIQVKVNVMNWGTVFPNDSVVVELFASLQDTAYQIGLIKRVSFGAKDSVYFPWVPNKGGRYTLTAKVNETNIIMEEDHSDNVGIGYFLIFNIDEPNILTPIDGFVSGSNQIEFNFADIGYYLPKELKYYIEIDTSRSFSNPLFSSSELTPNKSHVKWISPNILPGVYFWRSRIFEGQDFGNWSPARSFSIMNESKDGYYAHENILKTFSSYNINYSEEKKSLVLNTSPLPARPKEKTLLKHFLPEPELPDSLHLTALATDGTYLYFGNIWATADSNGGKSMIYRVGTGNNGTVEGHVYGPFSSFRDSILNSMTYHSDGNIYVAVGMSHKLVRINTATQVVDSVDVPPGLLRWDNSKAIDGPVYIASDGNYIYNLTTRDTSGNYKYTLRTFDPANNWETSKPDMVLTGTSFEAGMTSFFVHGNYIYPTEYFNANYMRRIRLSDGIFEEEWVVMHPFPQNFQSYYSWCWDWQNDHIYASVYRASGFEPKFSRFAGYYVDANGNITSQSVGPVAWWDQLKYDFINPSSTGEYSTYLLGQNSTTKNWDTLQVNVPDSISLSGINADEYPNLRLRFDMTDSTFTTTEPMELKSVHFDYQPLSDAYVEREDFYFQQDSLLQGYPVTFDYFARNFGELPADSMKLSFYLNGLDSLIYDPIVNIPGDSSSIKVQYTIDTKNLLFESTVSVLADQDKREYFYFNNLVDKQFFVARDSIRPVFDVKFDGQEIIDNDIVSSTPEVVIRLEDNSPLPLDTTFFTIVHNNKPLRFYQPELSYEYGGVGTPFLITWKPVLPDSSRLLSPPERNTFEVLAKDASGNFFDSTSYRVIFNVYTENDISDVFNYPNPFTSSTHFTFILKGNDKPYEINLKIFTVAGRLIRDIKLTPTDLITNFNKIYWDGRDEDGDEIGNGVYFYKLIAKFPDKTKTITQKLAKVR